MKEEMKLKPCPFCGNSVKIEKLVSYLHPTLLVYHISCTNAGCKVFPTTDGFKTEEEAIEAWNTRKGKD